VKIFPRSSLLLLAYISLLTCGSLDNFESGAGGVNADPDPSLYFSRHADKTYRAAVLTFTSREGIAFFDAFVSDEVIRRLSVVKNLVLVERTRIDLVLQEHAISQSGIIRVKDAPRLGTLLAVDLLVEGTYVYKDEAIFVRGRTVDAATGKVAHVFAFQLPYRAAKAKAPAEESLKADKGCEGAQRPVLLALNDLSTPAAVENAVDRAVELPWKKPCGRIHVKVCSDFAHTNLFPRRYHEFLARTLESMEDPGEEYYTVREIFEYFAHDGSISEFEWAAAREIMKRGWHQFYLKYFFKPERYVEAVMHRRILDLLELARDGQIGRPYALTEHRIGRDLLVNAMDRKSEKGIALSLFLLRSLRRPALAPVKEAKLFFDVIKDCYEDTVTPEYRKESMDLLIGFMKSRPPDRDSADELWSFLYRLEEKSHEKPAPYIPHLAYDPADLQRMYAELGEYLCPCLKNDRASHADEIGEYLRRYGVACP